MSPFRKGPITSNCVYGGIMAVDEVNYIGCLGRLDKELLAKQFHQTPVFSTDTAELLFCSNT